MRHSSRKRSHWTDWKRRGWGNNTPIVQEGCDSIDWGGLEAWSWAKPRTGAIWIDWDGLQVNIDLPENTTACCYNIYSISNQVVLWWFAHRASRDIEYIIDLLQTCLAADSPWPIDSRSCGDLSSNHEI